MKKTTTTLRFVNKEDNVTIKVDLDSQEIQMFDGDEEYYYLGNRFYDEKMRKSQFDEIADKTFKVVEKMLSRHKEIGQYMKGRLQYVTGVNFFNRRDGSLDTLKFINEDNIIIRVELNGQVVRIYRDRDTQSYHESNTMFFYEKMNKSDVKEIKNQMYKIVEKVISKNMIIGQYMKGKLLYESYENSIENNDLSPLRALVETYKTMNESAESLNESEDYFRHKGRLTSAGPTEKVHIDEIEPGDTVYHNGKARTVTKKDIGHDSTMGKTIFGDSYKLGRQEVERVLFKKWTGTHRKSFKWVAQP